MPHEEHVFIYRHTLGIICEQQWLGIDACNRNGAEFLLLQGQRELPNWLCWSWSHWLPSLYSQSAVKLLVIELGGTTGIKKAEQCCTERKHSNCFVLCISSLLCVYYTWKHKAFSMLPGTSFVGGMWAARSKPIFPLPNFLAVFS